MALSITHQFTDPKADGPDATIVRPSDWNATHTFTTVSGVLLGRMTAGGGVVEELTGFTITGSILSSFVGGAPGGIGYATGAGGSVTQLTSKATICQLDKPTGTVVTAADALAANTMVSFQLTNACSEPTDAVVLNHRSGGTAGAYALNGRCLNGAITVEITNRTGGSLSEAITIKFALIKAVNS